MIRKRFLVEKMDFNRYPIIGNYIVKLLFLSPRDTTDTSVIAISETHNVLYSSDKYEIIIGDPFNDPFHFYEKHCVTTKEAFLALIAEYQRHGIHPIIYYRLDFNSQGYILRYYDVDAGKPYRFKFIDCEFPTVAKYEFTDYIIDSLPSFNSDTHNVEDLGNQIIIPEKRLGNTIFPKDLLSDEIDASSPHGNLFLHWLAHHDVEKV